MQIGGLQKITLIDYPGKVATTVFLTGCNFRCPFCYSSELVLPEKIKRQPIISSRDFFKFLEKRKGLLEGVVICGGEPTLNEDLPQFCRKIKKLGYSVKIDTNGSNPEMLKKLIESGLADYIAMDIKAPKEEYDESAGVKVDVEKIQKSIDILKEGKVDYEFRSTIVPGLHTKEDVISMAEWLKGAKKYLLQDFRPEKTLNPEFEKIKSLPKEFLLEIKEKIAGYFEICEVR
ncbi:MAG TPA: anaerobic ribonucleoside-triphosphate reductase activating protein [Patescibacteria group bacterium]|nr:anaerobic ribonucleoside-triphosphate reductase activating protein [Patescibacteria group bacterium]